MGVIIPGITRNKVTKQTRNDGAAMPGEAGQSLYLFQWLALKPVQFFMQTDDFTDNNYCR